MLSMLLLLAFLGFFVSVRDFKICHDRIGEVGSGKKRFALNRREKKFKLLF